MQKTRHRDAVSTLARHFGQVKTAKMLGLSQPSISLHVNRKSLLRADRRQLAVKMAKYYFGSTRSVSVAS